MRPSLRSGPRRSFPARRRPPPETARRCRSPRRGVPGDPRDPATQLAPLSTQKAADNLAAEVTAAVENGAKAETLGQPVPAQRAFFQPVILTGVSTHNPAF
jgi:acyl-CoA reductase-like NAD-dependent aldehyde dehydrogenase